VLPNFLFISVTKTFLPLNSTVNCPKWRSISFYLKLLLCVVEKKGTRERRRADEKEEQ
jgi:hypothetical protein